MNAQSNVAYIPPGSWGGVRFTWPWNVPQVQTVTGCDSTSAAPQGNCRHCGRIHHGRCPEIAAIEYYPDGTVKRIEYRRGG